MYLCLHVIMIFFILLMATMRQSYLALLYAIILFPHLKDGADVLKQRDMQLQKLKNSVEEEEEALVEELCQNEVLEKIYGEINAKTGP